MSTLRASRPLGPTIMLAAAIIGAGIALYYYLTPLTGINGQPGTLLVIVSSLLLALDAIIFFLRPRGIVFGIFWALGLLGIIGTLAAAWFLHAWWLMLAIAVVFIGLVAILALRRAP